jgi:glycine oxidase
LLGKRAAGCYVEEVKVAIVGGGIMGCATALELAARGASCVVLERSVPGAEASSAAAGVLGAQIEAHAHRALLGTFVRARQGYGTWAERLRSVTGIDVGHRVCGALRVARNEDEASEMESEVTWQRREGLRAELVDAKGAKEIEPALDARIARAVHFPDEAQVDPPSLLRALVASLAHAGIVTKSGATVQSLLVERERCAGVRVDDGELHADAVVLAAGSWASLVPGLPSQTPRVRPVRGQIVQLEERPPTLRTMIVAAQGYVVPRGDGRVLVGSTMENVGYRKEVTAGGVRAILDCALDLVPSLESAAFAATWSNFRPKADGDDPLVGASSMPGLFLATGHFRNGILLAHETAQTVASAILR